MEEPRVSILEEINSPDPDVRQRAAQHLNRKRDTRSLDLLFRLLGDRDWRVRKTVIDGLIAINSDEVIVQLIQALFEEENAGKRNSATEALTRIGTKALPYLIYELEKTPNYDVKLALVNLLGDIHGEEGFETLMRLARTEEDVNVVSAVAGSLGRYRRPESADLLLEILERDDPWLRYHVIEALGVIGDPETLPAIIGLWSHRELQKPILEAIGAIADVGTVGFLLKVMSASEKLELSALQALMRVYDAKKPRIVKEREQAVIRRQVRESFPGSQIPALIEGATTASKRETREFLTRTLGWTGDERVLPVLVQLLTSGEYSEIAAQSLIDYGQLAVPHVVHLLAHPDDEDLTSSAIKILEALGDSRAVAPLLSLVEHPNAFIRRQALEALGRLPDVRSIDFLLSKLDDEDIAVQLAAVNTLVALSEAPEFKEQIIPKTRRLLKNPSVPVKLNSLTVFVNVQGEGYHDELLLGSKDEDPIIRQKAISLMGRFREHRFGDQLIHSLTDEDPQVRLAAINSIVSLLPEEGLQPLIASLEDADVWIRTAAAKSLGGYGCVEAIAPLVSRLERDLPPVRIAAIEALGKLGHADVKAVLFRRLADDDIEIVKAAIAALTRVEGEDVFQKLLSFLEDPEWRVRSAAIMALGNRGEGRALDSLHNLLLTDDDDFVKQSIVVALEKIGDRSSFPFLLEALENDQILDDVCDLLIRRNETYHDLLEEEWRRTDRKKEVVIAEILQRSGRPGPA